MEILVKGYVDERW